MKWGSLPVKTHRKTDLLLEVDEEGVDEAARWSS